MTDYEDIEESDGTCERVYTDLSNLTGEWNSDGLDPYTFTHAACSCLLAYAIKMSIDKEEICYFIASVMMSAHDLSEVLEEELRKKKVEYKGFTFPEPPPKPKEKK